MGDRAASDPVDAPPPPASPHASPAVDDTEPWRWFLRMLGSSDSPAESAVLAAAYNKALSNHPLDVAAMHHSLHVRVHTPASKTP